jgi:hypothetical protein
MKKIYLFTLLLFLTGCADKTGFTLHYYSGCYGEYDYYGEYREVCPHNLIDYKTIKAIPEKLKKQIAKDKETTKDNGQCLQCN